MVFDACTRNHIFLLEFVYMCAHSGDNEVSKLWLPIASLLLGQGWRARRTTDGFHQPFVRGPGIERAVNGSTGKVPNSPASGGDAPRLDLEGHLDTTLTL